MKKYNLKMNVLLFFLVCFCCVNNASSQKNATVVYLPTVESLSQHKTFQWFNDAKLGIFIHWGLYSVPAWATPTTTPDKVTDWKAFYKSNPYAEWYLNS